MKILLVSTTALPVPPPAYGGIEKIVYYLCRGLAALGHEVTLAAPKRSKPPPLVNTIFTTDPGNIAYEEAAYQIYRDVLEDQDIICDHSLLKVASKEMPNQLSKRYVAVCHTLDLPPFLSTTSKVVCVSRAHARFIAKKYGYNTGAILNGIDPTEYGPVLDTSEKTDRFVFLGRLTPEKGVREAISLCNELDAPLDIIEGTGREPMILRLARRMASRGIPTDYAVRLAYRGPFGIAYLLRAIREARSAKFTYRTNVGHELKVDLLSHARAMIFPVQYEEPFGLMVVEAMACGTPVVAYRRGAMAELIEDRKTGFLIEPDNRRAFMEAMKNVQSIRPTDCREHVMKNFTADIMVKNYETLFKEVIEGATS